MPVKYTVTLTSVGTSGVVTIPKPVIEGFGLEKGQKLELIVRDDGLYIQLLKRKKRVYNFGYTTHEEDKIWKLIKRPVLTK